VEIVHLANEGFLLRSGEVVVLIDALFGDGLEGYEAVDSSERERMESALPPWNGVDLVLATHHHADHFDAAAVARHLRANPDATFASTPQAIARLEAEMEENDVFGGRILDLLPAEGGRREITIDGVRVEGLNLTHGRERRPPVQNVGFLVEIGGRRILHLGDSEADAEDFRRSGLPGDGVDVALVPFWYLTSESDSAMVTRELAPARVVAIHLPREGAAASYFGRVGSRAGLEELLRAISTGSEVLLEPGSAWSLPAR
jgi:L-ascorbate metabolism protein UlaG (beta-lactamase superfamily)